MSSNTDRDAGEPQPATGILLGRDADVIGVVSAISEGNAAITLSIGGAPKRYAHADPNEDAAAFAVGPSGTLLAVADGHWGRIAAEIAVDLVVERGASWTHAEVPPLADGWRELAAETLASVQQAILARVASATEADTSRTTLAFALLRPDQNLAAFASVGDSHVFEVSGSHVVDLAGDPGHDVSYLGNFADEPAEVIQRCVVGVEPLDDTLALVLATDGLSEHGIGVDLPEAVVNECASQALAEAYDLRGLATATRVTEAALAAHARRKAGDNIAVAAAWTGRPGSDPGQ